MEATQKTTNGLVNNFSHYLMPILELEIQQKGPRRLFMTNLPNQVMPMEWTESDFARELMAFSERKDQIEALKAAEEAHKKLLVAYCQRNQVKEFVIANHRFTCKKSTKRVFSSYVNREIKRYEEKIKEAKEKAIENEEKGIQSKVTCSTTVNEFNTMERRALAEVEE
tara:strand:- start:5147 stop:5650 length:504 start_codon:yes stop_codon:yes gene_type:complete